MNSVWMFYARWAIIATDQSKASSSTDWAGQEEEHGVIRDQVNAGLNGLSAHLALRVYEWRF
jgi:hypothetical protein